MPTLRAFTEVLAEIVNVLKTKCKVCGAVSMQELKNGAPRPKIMQVDAIWDTGATASCISQKVVDILGLIPTGKVRASTAAGVIEVYTYTVNVLLPCSVRISYLQVSCMDMGDIDMLIGMDIISRGDFTITNNGRTKFTFQTPSTHDTDYKAELEDK